MSAQPTNSPNGRVHLSGCRVGANPIIWSNDDFHELAGDLPLDAILREMNVAGYAGSEMGHAYPRTTSALADALSRHELQLVSGWHSTYLASRELAMEAASFRHHLDLLKSLGADLVIVAECTRSIHGERDTPLGFGNEDRACLTESEWAKVTAGLTHLTKISAAAGMKVGYHHHMGTVIQTEPELDQLLAAVPDLSLLLDPGHLAFAGVDPLAITRRYASRIRHVHLKSVRRPIADRARAERWSFCRAVTEGVFTIPGDGCVDFPAIFRQLATDDYCGWLVVEAEEDPAKVPALPKAKIAREYVRTHAGV